MANPGIPLTSMGDLQQATLPQLNRMKLVEIASDLRDLYVAGTLLTKGNTITVDSGKSFQWDVMVNDSGTAANVQPGYQDNPNVVDTLVQATANWCMSKVDWAMFGPEEQMNSGESRIVDIKVAREKSAMIAFAILLEANFFGPSVASSDAITPWGMKTWITRPASYSADGFTGSTVSGGPSTLGLSPVTYPRWRSWYGQYTNAVDDDFVRRANKALFRTNFKAPVQGLPLLNTYGAKRLLFTNYGLLQGLQEYLKASNESLGLDISKYLNAVVINNVPCLAVDYLEADTTNPLYGVDVGAFRIYRLKNWWNRPTSLPNTPGQHTVASDYRDFIYQFVMVTRRTSFCLATSVTDPS